MNGDGDNYGIRALNSNRPCDNLAAPSSGQFRCVLKASNGETIATAELYTTKSAAKDGIDAVRASQ